MEHGGGMHIKTAPGGTTSGGESDNGSGMASPGTSSMDELSNDAEGIWSQDIEQSFQEALAIYPPCGRRKIILSDEGKMYGRNELIARYIKLRTGKTRTRKQVSSHIQVLSRRKAKDGQPQIKDHSGKEMLQNMSSISPSQINSAIGLKPANVLQHAPPLPPLQSVSGTGPAGVGADGPVGFIPSMYAAAATGHPAQLWNPSAAAVVADAAAMSAYYGMASQENKVVIMPNADNGPPWRDRSIAGPMLRLVELSAFVERQPDDLYNRHLFVHIGSNVTHADPLLESVDIRQIADKFPDKVGGLRELYEKGPHAAFFLVKFWADINTDITDEMHTYYAVSNLFESNVGMTIECSTKLCSFGKQVVEKLETTTAQREGNRFVYKFERGQMCEYLVNFIHKLKQLPEKFMMNSVLENFTILQIVVNQDTRETLLCIAYVFEVSTSEHGAQYHIYRLMKD